MPSLPDRSRRRRMRGRRIGSLVAAVSVAFVGLVSARETPAPAPAAIPSEPGIEAPRGVLEVRNRTIVEEPDPSPEPVALMPMSTDVEPPARPTPTATPTPEEPTPEPSATTVASTPAATATPSPTTAEASTSGTTAVSVDPRVGDDFILVSRSYLVSRPTSGSVWNQLKAVADGEAGTPNLSVNDQDNNVRVLAKAIVFARTGDGTYRAEVVEQLKAAVGTEGGDTLALGREAAAYALAADFIDLGTVDAKFDQNIFRPWLGSLLTKSLDGATLQSTHENRPNNWGTHAGASRAAIAMYLGDSGELARVATVFRGWLGDRSAYSGFRFGDLSWQADRSKPVGINPRGATIDGENVDGVLPDDQRRTGGFAWPPPCGNYPHGAMDGALLTAEILTRAGYAAYEWSDRALLRAATWLHDTGCPPSGDNLWHLPLLDARYGTSWWNGAPVPPGKNFGWTDWLYGS